jgi:hypothetical protein
MDTLIAGQSTTKREYIEFQNVTSLSKGDVIAINGRAYDVVATDGDKVRCEPVVQFPRLIYDEASTWPDNRDARIAKSLRRKAKREKKRWKKIHSRQGRQ